MPVKAITLLLIVLCVALCTCSDDNSNPTYPFERTVLDVSVKKGLNKDSSYFILWRHPIEKKDLKAYYIWVDTTVVKDTVQNISQAQMNLADTTVDYSGKGEGDSLDLTNLIKGYFGRDSVHVAIWARYSGNEKGAVQHLFVFFGDDIPPSIVHLSDSVAADTIWLEWIRPTDQRDFYEPGIINGPIAGYNVRIEASAGENIRDAANINVSLAETQVSSNNFRRNQRFKKEGRKPVIENITTTEASNILRLAIIDGKGFVDGETSENNWKMEISGLKPEQTYRVSIVAWDSAGNSSGTEASSKSISTTDAIAPLIANKFWLYKDSGDGLPRLDSNRLILFWPKSVDPLFKTTQIQIDSALYIPAGCAVDRCYKEVKGYAVERKNGNLWETPSRIYPVQIGDGYYDKRYRLENDSMIADLAGDFVSDTLSWILPGDTVILRMRAVDFSGFYSNAWIDTIVVSKGALWQSECPQNFVPVKKDDSVFCMEKLQHTVGNNGKEFERNVLYGEAKRSCEALSGKSGFENFTVKLCTEQEWNTACGSRGFSYGVIEERDFSPDKFLFANCGTGTGDSASAKNVNARKKICASPDGVRDLPGQLQEWVTGDSDTGEVVVLKGTSYAEFQGVSRVELSLCRNRFTPTRIRPRYTSDSVYLYRNASRMDTLFTRDTLRFITPDKILPPDRVLPPDSLPHIILVYNLKDSAGNYLGTDYVNQTEYLRRGRDSWLNVLWQGLVYEKKEELKAYISGTESIDASGFFLEPSVGFRCCAVKE